jgi:hypothetical protein
MGKDLSVDEVRNIVTGMQKALGQDARIMVRAMNIQHMFTFKKFSDDELNLLDFDDYLKNSVKETEKFETFKFVQITTLVDKPVKKANVVKKKVVKKVVKKVKPKKKVKKLIN